jgi:tetraacyldisaccharide 4'-kinase
MLQAQLPWLLQEQDPDRVAAGRRLVAAGANFIVLDDGFQHRRLHRDLDIVCLDAARPFGNGACLPAGDLREFRSGLRRAQVVLLTRASSVPSPERERLVATVRRIAGKPALPVFAADHEPLDIVVAPQGGVLPLASLRGQRVVLLTAIARPQSVRATVEALGAHVVREFAHRDHHYFTAGEVDAAVHAAHTEQAIVLTTAKDEARLGAFAFARQVLRIGLRFLGAAPTAAQVGIL